MFEKKWLAWLVIFAALTLVGGGAGWLFHAQGAATAGAITWIVCGVAAYLWTLYGLIRTRQYRLSKQILGLMLSAAAAALIAYGLVRINYDGSAIVVLGVWCMTAGFILGLTLIRGVLVGGHPIVAVGRTVIDEAIRMKVALIFIVLLVVLVPLLPFALDPEEQLRYRLQFFLTWSLGWTSFLLSMLTVFLAVGTITREIASKEIFITMTKPISRAQFLLGKWLGICMLNLLLVALAGGTVFVLAKMLQTQPANDRLDREAVDQQVMVARVGMQPNPPFVLRNRMEARLEELQRAEPEIWGEPGTTLDELPRNRQAELRLAVINDWRTIGPRERKTFLFEGIEVERLRRYYTRRDIDQTTSQPQENGGQQGQFLHLHIDPSMSNRPPDGIARIALWVNDRPYPLGPNGQHQQTQAIARQRNVIYIPLALVDDQGNLALTIQNVNLRNPDMTHPGSVTFEPGEDMELFYPVGDFLPNLARTMVILWVRLAFLAILGLFAGTFLGFPVACLLTFTIYGIALASSYIDFSLGFYAGAEWKQLSLPQVLLLLTRQLVGNIAEGSWLDAFKTFIRMVGETAINAVPAFSEYNPVPLVSDGRLVSTKLAGKAVLMIGVLWSGGAALVAWMIFRRRELARVTY